MGAETQQRHAALLREIGIPQRSRPGSFEAVLEVVEDLPRGRALDVPCGAGLLSQALQRLGFEVTAADLDAEGFRCDADVAFRQLDLDEALPFEAGVFDLVVCGDGIEHIENPFALLREFARILAEQGRLVVLTPNYLNLERRLRFLLSGSLTKPLPRAREAPAKAARGHINPLTLIRLAQMAESAGLELVASRTLLPKPRQRLLAPLALLLLLYRALLPARRKRDLFAEHSLGLGTLLGGHKLLAVFRKAR